MKRKIFNYNNFLILLYLVIVFITIFFHEIWFDEAQSWLLARDLGWMDIIKQMSYEGHSCFYYYFLKILIIMGLDYHYMGYISLVVGLIATIIFVYKAPFNNIIKTLWILSPAIIYLCPVFSRPYIFSLLFMIIICILYKDRYKYSWLFGIILFLFINSHILTIPMVLSIMIIEIYDYFFVDKKHLKERIVMGSLSLFGVIIFALQLLGSFNNRSDILSLNALSDNFIFLILSIRSNMIALFGNVFLSFIGLAIFILLINKIKSNKKSLFIIIFNTVVFMLFAFFVFSIYQSKLIYIVEYILFALWLFYEDNKVDNSVNKLLIYLLLISSISSFKMISYDVFNDYSNGEIIAAFFNNDKRENIRILSYTDCPEVIIHLDNRYEFVPYGYSDNYTFSKYRPFKEIDGELIDYVRDNNFDYIISNYPVSIYPEDINNLIEKNDIEEVYLSNGSIIYKVNK